MRCPTDLSARDPQCGATTLVFVLLASVIAAFVLIFLFLHQTQLTSIGDRQNQVVSIAEQGVALYGAAQAVPVGTRGTYSPSQLIPGASDTLPWGNGWIAQTQPGGDGGKNVVSVYFHGPIQQSSGISDIADNGALQTALAWDVAGVMYQQVKDMPNTLVGVVQSGQTDLQVLSETSAGTTSVAETVSVSSHPAQYTTPMILGNYAATSQTGSAS